jgi:hypothetical protein
MNCLFLREYVYGASLFGGQWLVAPQLGHIRYLPCDLTLLQMQLLSIGLCESVGQESWSASDSEERQNEFSSLIKLRSHGGLEN